MKLFISGVSSLSFALSSILAAGAVAVSAGSAAAQSSPPPQPCYVVDITCYRDGRPCEMSDAKLDSDCDGIPDDESWG